MAKMKTLAEVEEDLAKAVGGKEELWSPRGRMYLLARIESLTTALAEAVEELRYEKDVNARVREVLSAWFGVRRRQRE